MSFTVLSNVFIANQQTQSWVATWTNQTWPDWPGIVVIQAQPVTTGASLACSTPSIFLAPSGEYSFSFSITNSGPNMGWYNLWIASNL